MSILTNKLFTLLRRGFTAATPASSSPKVRCANKISRQYKQIVVQETQKALTEYLNATQGLPFFFADQIAKNSLFSLSKLVRYVRFSAPGFPSTIRKHLRYEAINEFEFFFESIGIDHRQIPQYLPRDRFFLSDGGGEILGASVALFQFGFPWNTLGKLYAKKVSIFSRSGGELTSRLEMIRDYCGFSNLQLVAVFSAFPELLAGEGEIGGEFGGLFEDLKRVFKECDNGACMDGWYEVCCRILFLYDLGCEKGTVGDSMCRGKRYLLESPMQVLEDKANYFCKFGVGKDKVGPLLLRNPELLGLDLQAPAIPVSGLLDHFGLDPKELGYLSKKYPHVFGRNKMINLPGIMKALDLHEWFFDKIESMVDLPGIMKALDLHEWFFDKIESLGCQILATYAIGYYDQKVDKKFIDSVKKLESTRCSSHTMEKLDFLMGLGFGDNTSTLQVLRVWLSSSSGFQARFDYFLGLGIKYSEICLMVKIAPRIFCFTPELMEKKIDYLRKEMGTSIKYLVCFPRILVYDLENRIKPRHRFCVWLKQNGLSINNYSVESMIDLSEKRFLARLFKIHRAAPKLYLESYLSKS